MAHFYLIGGHGDGDPGAVGNGRQEQALARQFDDYLAKHLRALKQTVTVYDKSKDMFKQTKKGQGLYVFGVNGRIVLETHLNAATDKSAKGCETLIASGTSADKYDNAIQNTLKKYFTNRGIKKRSDLLNMNVAKQRGINYRLIELCFISNKNDVNKLVKDMDKIAKDMAQAMVGKGSATATKLPAGVTAQNKTMTVQKKIGELVRLGTALTSTKIATKKKGSKITFRGWIINNGYMWRVYWGSYKGKSRWLYMAEYKISKPNNKFME